MGVKNNFIYGELGRYPLRLRRLIRIIKFWFKVVRCKNVKYIKIVYNMMFRDLELHPEHNSWAKSVKVLLENLGFYYVWLNQGVENVNMFLKLFKERLYDNFKQNWTAELEFSSRARTFSLFCSFEYQKYLDEIKVNKFKVALTRFRTSAHRLEIEAGRWHKPTKIPSNGRKCKICNNLEDEFHFFV